MVHIMNMMQSDMWSLFLHVEEFNMIHDGTLDGIIQQHVHGYVMVMVISLSRDGIACPSRYDTDFKGLPVRRVC